MVDRLLESDLDMLSPDQVRTLVHELRQHQDELETQNQQLRTMQVSLDEARARYFRLYDLAPVGFVILDQEDRLQEANIMAAELFGVPRSELPGAWLSRFIADEDQAMHHKRRQAPRDLDTRQSYELRMKRADGARFLAQVHEITVAGDPRDRPVEWMTISDISAREEAERARHELVGQKLENLRLRARDEQHMRALLDASFDDVLLVQRTGTILAANHRSATRLGVPRTELLGANAFESMPLQVRDARRAWFQEAIEAREPITREDEIEGRCFETSIHPLFDERGQVDRLAINTRDITEARHNTRELERMVALAEAASRAKSEFLANMSHEIRTPMNGVIGYTTLLLEQELDPEVADMIETIQQSGHSLMGIIDDILDFSKIEAGKLSMEAIPFDLSATIGNVLIACATQAADKGIELIADVDDHVPSQLVGDPSRIGQVLSNLLGNALKFTEAGYVSLRIRVEGGNRESVTLRFEVSDTGIGVAADRQSALFDAFTQADTSTTRQFGGTGLGLSIARKLVTLMGGDIGLDSRLGHGSTFWFTVPLPIFSHERPSLASWAGLDQARVLLVDDQPLALAATSRLLTRLGIRHATAGSGDAALDALRAGHAADPFAMAIIDHHMPGMDGVALARAIKSDLALHDTVLLLMAAMGIRGRIEIAARAGFSGHVSKPVLVASLQHALCRSWPSASAPDRGAALGSQPARQSVAEPALEARVLVVEDNLVNQRVAARLLTRIGCQVDLASNGLEALESLERGSYDLIFMDCQMPEMDGYQATRAIRAMPGGERVPIIAMTAHALQGDREKCLEAGMDDYLAKPVTHRAVKRMVEKQLSRGPSGEPEAAAEPQDGPGKRTILLVEDSTTQRLALSLYLKHEGYEVVEARHGEEGLGRACDRHFDAIVVDHNMPVMSGLEMVTAVRKLESHRTTPIIVLTCEPPDEAWRQLGIDFWLRKSDDVQILGTLLERWFKRG